MVVSAVAFAVVTADAVELAEPVIATASDDDDNLDAVAAAVDTDTAAVHQPSGDFLAGETHPPPAAEGTLTPAFAPATSAPTPSLLV